MYIDTVKDGRSSKTSDLKDELTLVDLKCGERGSPALTIRFLSDSDSGMWIYDLKKILGPSSVQTTERYLGHTQAGTRIKGTIWDF